MLRVVDRARGINWGVLNLVYSKILYKSDSSGVFMNPDPSATCFAKLTLDQWVVNFFLVFL